MKRFRAFGERGNQKYSGIFTAMSREEARQKLELQGYTVLTLEEVRFPWPLVIVVLAITLGFTAFIVWSNAVNKPEQPVSIQPASRHAKTPMDVLGKWVTLRYGPYLIATTGETFARAMNYKNSKDASGLAKMVSKNEVGRTQQFGGGQQVYVNVWHDADHAVEIKFKDTGVFAWVEEKAVL